MHDLHFKLDTFFAYQLEAGKAPAAAHHPRCYYDRTKSQLPSLYARITKIVASISR